MVESGADLVALRAAKRADIDKLPEVRQHQIFKSDLIAGACKLPSDGVRSLAEAGMDQHDVTQAIRAGMATSLLHMESRICSSLGQGFYTIGPGGEELMAAIGLLLRPSDMVALHYRHLATQVLFRHNSSCESVA